MGVLISDHEREPYLPETHFVRAASRLLLKKIYFKDLFDFRRGGGGRKRFRDGLIALVPGTHTGSRADSL